MGSYHNYKRCNIYETNIKDICNFWGGPLPLGKQWAYEKKDGIDCFTQSIIKTWIAYLVLSAESSIKRTCTSIVSPSLKILKVK